MEIKRVHLIIVLDGNVFNRIVAYVAILLLANCNLMRSFDWTEKYPGVESSESR